MTGLQDLISDIGYFFYEQASATSNKEKVDIASDRITRLGITHISINGDTVIFTLVRPGLLVGRKGETINALKEYLKKITNGKIQNIDIIEEHDIQHLFSFQISNEYLT